MEQTRDFKGVWIPKEIWLSEKLSAVDKIILAEIDSLDNERHCYASNDYFAKFCGVSEATVKRSIQTLINLGYIEKISFDGRTRVLGSKLKMSQQTAQNELAASAKCATNNIDTNLEDNKNSVSNETPDEPDEVTNLDDDVASKVYNADEFLGCRKKNKKKSPQPPKKNLYQKCIDANLGFTGNVITQSLLESYLRLRLQMKDKKPLYSVEQWNNMLEKLSQLSSDDATDQKIIKQSIERGWAAFFPLDDEKRSNYYNTGDTDASGNKSVIANKIKKEEDDDDETDQVV